MAIAETGAIYKSLSFDGVTSRTYGVYITGQAVYNAPQRDVEMITIPGRNGAFALDHGRFENIEVTYPAGIFAENEADFAQGISDFRNYLCSRKGYVRLSDEYNPDEYRLAVYKSGLEVNPAQLRAGEFDITFECKPQRYLTSGEEAKTMGTWGETETAEGSIATFTAQDGDGAKSVVAEIVPVQSGSGDPSPTNVRAISGFSSVNVYVSPTTQQADATVYTTSLGSTYYGGTLDVTTGTLTVDRKFVTLLGTGDTKFYKSTSITGSNTFYTSADALQPTELTNVTDLLCSHFKTSLSPGTTEMCCYMTSTRFRIRLPLDNSLGISTADDMNTWLATQYTNGTPVTYAVKLVTPQTYSLTPAQVSLLVGTNNVWADTGDVAVEYGEAPNVMVNPTLFESSPLLEVKGYGNISFNDYSIDLDSAFMGEVILLTGPLSRVSGGTYSHLKLNAGDTLTLSPSTWDMSIYVGASHAGEVDAITDISMTINSQQTTGTPTFSYEDSSLSVLYKNAKIVFPAQTFTQGVYDTVKDNITLTVTYEKNGVSNTATLTGDFGFKTVLKNSNYSYFKFVSPPSVSLDGPVSFFLQDKVNFQALTGDSTQTALGNPTYIDCDLGQAFKTVNGEPVSLNEYIDLGSDLPTLKSGANPITYDNTITELKIIPRWWKV